MKILKKLLILTFFLTCLIGIIGSVTAIIYFDEVNTIINTKTLVKKTSTVGGVYKTDVQGDYYMDQFIELNGARSYDDLAKFISIHVTNGITPIFDVKANVASSSSQAFTFNDTVNGTTSQYLAKNYNADAASLMIVNTDPSSLSKYASTSIVDLTFINQDKTFSLNGYSNLNAMAATYFPIDGINEKGLSASLQFTIKETSDKATTENTSKVNVTETVMLRLILDNTKTVEDAIALIDEYDVFSSSDNYFSFFIADATGTSAIVNAQPNGDKVELVTYYNDNNDSSENSIYVDGTTNEVNNNFQYITNFILNGGYYSSTTGLNINDYKLIENTINTDGSNNDGSFALDSAKNLLKEFKSSTSQQLYSVIYNMTDCSVQYYFQGNFTATADHKFTFSK